MVKGIFGGHLKSTQPTEAVEGACYWAEEGRLGGSLEAGAWPLLQLLEPQGTTLMALDYPSPNPLRFTSRPSIPFVNF